MSVISQSVLSVTEEGFAYCLEQETSLGHILQKSSPDPPRAGSSASQELWLGAKHLTLEDPCPLEISY